MIRKFSNSMMRIDRMASNTVRTNQIVLDDIEVFKVYSLFKQKVMAHIDGEDFKTKSITDVFNLAAGDAFMELKGVEITRGGNESEVREL